jgi:hypothetical protein
MLQLRKSSNQRTIDSLGGGASNGPQMIPMSVIEASGGGGGGGGGVGGAGGGVSGGGGAGGATNATAILNNSNIISQALISNLQQQQLQQQFDDAINNPMSLEWINKPWIQRIIRICALCSFISICANTPETFKKTPLTIYLTYFVDACCTCVFTIEMIAKIKTRNLFRGEYAYIFDRWCQFDGIMVLFHLVSVILQVSEC